MDESWIYKKIDRKILKYQQHASQRLRGYEEKMADRQ